MHIPGCWATARIALLVFLFVALGLRWSALAFELLLAPRVGFRFLARGRDGWLACTSIERRSYP